MKQNVLLLCPVLVPTSPPQSVVVQSSTATQLDVTWDPPPLDAQNGDIQGYKVWIMYLFFCCCIKAFLHHAFLMCIFAEKRWILHPELIYSVYRSISGSFSSRMRRSACELCSCPSLEWSWKTSQATPPTWSVWQPSMLQGMGPAPCPLEGALSKQVSNSKATVGSAFQNASLLVKQKNRWVLSSPNCKLDLKYCSFRQINNETSRKFNILTEEFSFMLWQIREEIRVFLAPSPGQIMVVQGTHRLGLWPQLHKSVCVYQLARVPPLEFSVSAQK